MGALEKSIFAALLAALLPGLSAAGEHSLLWKYQLRGGNDSEYVYNVEVTPGGSFVGATNGFSKIVEGSMNFLLFHRESGQAGGYATPLHVLSNTPGGFHDLALAPDGRFIALSATNAHGNTRRVFLYDANIMELWVKEFAGINNFNHIEMSADASFIIAAGDKQGEVDEPNVVAYDRAGADLWNTSTGMLNHVRSLYVTRGAEYVAAGTLIGLDNLAHLYLFDRSGSEILHFAKGLEGEGDQPIFRGASVTPDGRYLAACSADGFVYLFDTTEGDDPAWSDLIEDPFDVAMAADGEKLFIAVVARGEIRLYDEDGSVVWTHSKSADRLNGQGEHLIAISGDGKYIAAPGGIDTHEVCFFDNQPSGGDKVPLWSFETQDQTTAIDMNDSGDYLAIGTFGHDIDNIYFFSTGVESPPAPSLTLISPNGGERWQSGSQEEVVWEVSGGTGPYLVTVDLSTTGADGEYRLVRYMARAESPFALEVPQASSDDCYFRVSVMDVNGRFGADASDGAFSIGSGNPPPEVRITSPENGAGVSGLVRIEAEASGEDGVTQVAFVISGEGETLAPEPVTASPYAYEWNTEAVKDGFYSIRATATDNGGRTAADQINVTVANETEEGDGGPADAGGEKPDGSTTAAKGAEDGCGCRTASTAAGGTAALLALLGCIFFVRRRERR